MMLTLDTAKQLGVDNRLDPGQSIEGGARYLAGLYNKIPERIKDPDRMWFALASYNVGFEHLEDVRILTEKQGGNPDSWIDVRKSLPMLSEKKWYKQTRYGYARGSEPVVFVENIRRYRDILSWLSALERQQRHEPDILRSLAIDSPVL
jgi:membrane-bound lytic murein transglycosylase F